jgi:AcrR family transcriptional regulator
MTNKDRILETALRLFAEQGYDRSSTSLIARTAGVSEGLIFRHYGHKAGLLEAILYEGMAQIAQSMEAYQQHAYPRAAILDHIDRAGRLLVEHRPFWQLVHRIRFQAAIRETAGAALADMNRTIVGQLTHHFQRLSAPDPVAEAELLFATIDGIAIHYVEQPDAYPLEAVLKRLKDHYQK